ncbi:MAG: hypothetical protein WCT52_05230 [Candidatus Micrarchaeia archaeon]
MAFPEELRGMKVCDLNRKQTDLLYGALEELQADEVLDSERTLSFIADRYHAEKQKGAKGNAKAMSLIESLIFRPEVLHGVKVGELGEKQTDALYGAMEKLQMEATLDAGKSLAFLADAWVAEKAKGKSANTDAMKLIESLAKKPREPRAPKRRK